MVIDPAVCVGTVRHRRFAIRSHAFTYRVFMALIDIDRIDELMAVSPLTSRNRWNWASFDDRDHLGDPARPLRERVQADAAAAGVTMPAGRVLLLTHLRYLGYCFNPVSFYYCFDAHDELQLVLAEVNNTFGGSHRYWLAPEPQGRTFRAAAAKRFYVSPFLDADLDYRFAFSLEGGRLAVHMDVLRAGSVTLDATLTLERRPWSGRELIGQLIRQPAMTARVMGAIHWQALRLWWKGVPVVKPA